MKRQVLSILTASIFGALFACKSAPEPERSPVPTERSEERTEETPAPMETPPEPAQTRSIDAIHDSVDAALNQAEGLDASRIVVVVDDTGVVHLSGTVASEEEKRRAHEIAHQVEGVQNVYIGELQVDTAQATR